MAEKGVEFSWFWAIRTIFASKITIFQVRPPIASSVWSKPFRTWKSRFFSNYLKQIDFSWHFCDFCRVPPHRGFSEKSQFWTRFWRSERSKWLKNMLNFRDFERSGRFSHQKPRFFRSGRQLPLARDRSRSERENHGFSAITLSKSIFRGIFVIFVGSPSRIFRKITILNTVLTISTR